jgi:DNA-binding NtrC family response regulator
MQAGSSPSWRTEPQILFVYPDQSDCSAFTDILSHRKCGLHRVQTCRDAISFLNEHTAGVVISNTNMSDGTWMDLLDRTSRLAKAPNLIVASRLADERFWAEVLNAGAYDLLIVPPEPEEVMRITTQAWQDWERRNTPTAQQTATAGSAVPFEGMMVARGEPDNRCSQIRRKDSA